MAGDLAAVGADFRRDGACVVRGLLDDVQVARLSEGVEDNLAAPSERAIEGGAESGSGRFFEDFRNWDRVREYEEVIRDARVRLVATRRSWRNALAQATVGMAARTAGTSGVAESSGRDRLAPSSPDESELAMAIGIYFSPESFPVDKYDSTLKDLENAGAGAPAGRLYHVAMESPGGVHVFDIWESKEAFEAFGATLLPILSAAGVNPGEPMISEVHNVITA